MKTKGTYLSIRKTIMILTMLLLIGVAQSMTVEAKTFFCTSPYDAYDPELNVYGIQTALNEALGNDQDDIILIIGFDHTYDINPPLVYIDAPDENRRLLIGGLPWAKPTLEGDDSRIMMLHTWTGRSADIEVRDIIFKNGHLGEGFAKGNSAALEVSSREGDIEVHSCLFQNNTTYDSYAAGLYIKAILSDRVTVSNNVFYDNINTHGDMGCALTIEINKNIAYVHVVNNFFHQNNSENGSGSGIFLKSRIYGGLPFFFYFNINNNILYGNHTSSGIEVEIDDEIGIDNLNIHNNVVDGVRHNTWIIDFDEDSGNWYRAPRMVDMVNFELRPDSPCIDTASQTSALSPGYDYPPHDYSGRSRIRDGNGDGSCVIDRGPVEYKRPDDTIEPRCFRFIPSIPQHIKNIKMPEGSPYYLQVGDIATNSDDKVGWTICNNREVPSGYTLYYGDPAANNYHTDQKANNGFFEIKDIDLKGMQEPKLSFMLFMDTQPGSKSDTMKVFANGKLVWEKNDQNVDMKTWQLIDISLKEFEGKTVDLKVEFDTRDSKHNHTEGIYIDEFMIL